MIWLLGVLIEIGRLENATEAWKTRKIVIANPAPKCEIFPSIMRKCTQNPWVYPFGFQFLSHAIFKSTRVLCRKRKTRNRVQKYVFFHPNSFNYERNGWKIEVKMNLSKNQPKKLKICHKNFNFCQKILSFGIINVNFMPRNPNFQ